MTTGTRNRPERRTAQGGVSARSKLAVVGAAGLCAGLLAAFFASWQLGPLLGWEVAAIAYVCWEWLTIWPMDADRTAEQAVREDPHRAAADVLLLLAAVASLLAVVLVIVTASRPGPVPEQVQIGLCVAGVACSWAVVHTVFTLRYARLYYTGRDGGVNFHQSEPPRYSDFAYLAFTIGMTFQVSDTDLTNAAIRSVALRHALLSYVFGAVILAAIINLVAGLTK